MSIQRHPRDITCRNAASAMRTHMLGVRKLYDLTDVEYLQMVGSACASSIAYYAQFELRIERHGNPDTPSGSVGSGKKSPVSDAFVHHIIEHVGEAFAADPEMDVDVLFDTTKELMDGEFGE